jgi:hypothetical protein
VSDALLPFVRVRSLAFNSTILPPASPGFPRLPPASPGFPGFPRLPPASPGFPRFPLLWQVLRRHEEQAVGVVGNLPASLGVGGHVGHCTKLLVCGQRKAGAAHCVSAGRWPCASARARGGGGDRGGTAAYMVSSSDDSCPCRVTTSLLPPPQSPYSRAVCHSCALVPLPVRWRLTQVSVGPGLVGALWGVFVFREIRGMKNYMLVVGGFALTITASILIAASH